MSLRRRGRRGSVALLAGLVRLAGLVVTVGLVGAVGLVGPVGLVGVANAVPGAGAWSAAPAGAGVFDASLADDRTIAGEGPRWRWPVAPASLSRSFEAPPTPYAAGHRGIDLRALPGSPVTAPSRATVRFAGMVVDRRVLTLDHGDGVLSSYEPVLSALSVGETVAAGDPLGTVDSGGHCAAACLHVGVRVDGEYVSPLLFFDRVPRAVLLPLGPAAG